MTESHKEITTSTTAMHDTVSLEEFSKASKSKMKFP